MKPLPQFLKSIYMPAVMPMRRIAIVMVFIFLNVLNVNAQFTIAAFCEIFMPNVFTPNGDGQDDVFRVKYPFPVKTFSFTIYNRWVQKIFETNYMNKSWDGVLQPTGSFSCLMRVVRVKNQPQILKGVVVHVR